ncbi:hypothetical protein C8Q79DRAFT_1011922 [Trametes meyenii]|nr:hypothetical protein C8Q79DRAFT_1011922 [Trametes meyenii]
MPRATYRERIKNVLCVLAQNDQETIPYAQFLERVETSMLLDLMVMHRGVDGLIRKAILCERCAHRIKFVSKLDGSIDLTLTPSGSKYFKNYGIVCLHHEDLRVLEKFTSRQLRKETRILNRVLENIHNVLLENGTQAFTPSCIEDIPAAVARVVQKMRSLGETNTELTSILAEERSVERATRAIQRDDHADD